MIPATKMTSGKITRKSRRPLRVFVGSSRESLAIAKRICGWITRFGAKPRLWTEPGIFNAGTFVLPELIRFARENADAAILVFGRDDRAKSRGRTRWQARDNVLIEYGLFAGIKGHEHAIAFRAYQANQPSDLAGISAVHCDRNRRGDWDRARLKIEAWLATLKSPTVIGSSPAAENRPPRRVSPTRARRRNLTVEYESILESDSGANPDSNDVIGTALATEIAERVKQQPLPCVIKQSTHFFIEKDGSCRFRIVQIVRGEKVPLQLSGFFISGDVPIEGIRDLKVRIRSLTPKTRVAWLLNENAPTLKSFVIAYDPPVLGRQLRETECTWRWPRVFARLTSGRVDHWDERVESSTVVNEMRFVFTVHPTLPEITVGRVGDDRPDSGLCGNDSHGNRRYEWVERNVASGSVFTLRLKPLPSRRGRVPR